MQPSNNQADSKVVILECEFISISGLYNSIDEFNCATCHIVDGADEFDLTLLFQVCDYRAALAYVLHGQLDISLSNHMEEFIISYDGW